MFSGKLCLGVFLVLVAYLYPRWYKTEGGEPPDTQSRIIAAWQAQITRPDGGFSRVSAGINACVDLIVPGVELLEKLHVPAAGRSDHETLASMSDLQETFHHFFHKGSAAERFFSDRDQFQTLVKAASSLKDAEWHVGGNAALITQKICETFSDVSMQLIGPVGPKTRELLNKKVDVPSSSLQDTDEVHLIMEYHVGDTWAASSAPVATRFITSNDASNSGMTSLSTFFASIVDYRPDLVIFSGLHMLDGQDAGYQEEMLGRVVDGFQRIPPSLPVHLELASLANTHLMSSIFEKVLTKVTALGLNEQELAFASHAQGGPHSDLYTEEGQPPVHKVTDILAWILQRYGHGAQRPDSRLTRVHFHSLTYHVIGTAPGTWRHLPAAVAAGTRMAGRQACDTGTLDPDKVELRIPRNFRLFSGDAAREFDPDSPVIAFSHQGHEFHFSPVLVCKVPLKTVGLGDAISATGLLYSTRVS